MADGAYTMNPAEAVMGESESFAEDSRAEISFNKDYSTAYIVVTEPRNGGRDITFDEIMDAIFAEGVSYGLVDDKLFNDIINKKLYDIRYEIARGKAPVSGKNGYIKYFFERNKVMTPAENENGEVDFKNLGTITNIYRGTKIGEIIPPTDGEPGINVLGELVAQTPGRPVNISLGKGTQLSWDASEILAAVDGNLVCKGSIFSVEEELVIKGDIDVSTGNIDFIGNITIMGNVFEGFSVYSKKNISIRGAAADADIRAGGNVEIKLGCLQSEVDCSGSFKADFCENCIINSGGDITANSFMGCEVFTKGMLIASGKGVISGGKYTAIKGIEASAIGWDSYLRTEIILGNNAVLMQERERHSKTVAELERTMDKHQKILDRIAEIQKEGGRLTQRHELLKSDSLRIKITTRNEINKLSKRINDINDALLHKENFAIVCKKRLYPGTIISIDSCSLTVGAEFGRCKVTIDHGEIVVLSV